MSLINNEQEVEKIVNEPLKNGKLKQNIRKEKVSESYFDR